MSTTLPTKALSLRLLTADGWRKVRGTDVDGGMHISDFAHLIGIELPHERYSTVAGVVLEHLQRIPEVGDSVVLDDRTLTVLEMDGRRISRVRVSARSS